MLGFSVNSMGHAKRSDINLQSTWNYLVLAPQTQYSIRNPLTQHHLHCGYFWASVTHDDRDYGSDAAVNLFTQICVFGDIKRNAIRMCLCACVEWHEPRLSGWDQRVLWATLHDYMTLQRSRPLFSIFSFYPLSPPFPSRTLPLFGALVVCSKISTFT